MWYGVHANSYSLVPSFSNEYCMLISYYYYYVIHNHRIAITWFFRGSRAWQQLIMMGLELMRKLRIPATMLHIRGSCRVTMKMAPSPWAAWRQRIPTQVSLSRAPALCPGNSAQHHPSTQQRRTQGPGWGWGERGREGGGESRTKIY